MLCGACIVPGTVKRKMSWADRLSAAKALKEEELLKQAVMATAEMEKRLVSRGQVMKEVAAIASELKRRMGDLETACTVAYMNVAGEETHGLRAVQDALRLGLRAAIDDVLPKELD